MKGEVVVRQRSVSEPSEVGPLARELAGAYRDRVMGYKHELGLTTAEAVAKADEPCSLGQLLTILGRAPEEVTWDDLQQVVGERGLGVWEEIKKAAQEELRSGHRAGGALLGPHPRAYELARFLAIRQELADGWQPRNGIERQLIDQMAQAQAAMYSWHERLADVPPGMHDEAEQAAAMVDRFSRMFQRVLRALCNLRRAPFAVIVQNAGQVNVGGQQVNVAPGRGKNGSRSFRGTARKKVLARTG